MRSTVYLCSSLLLPLCGCGAGTWVVGEAEPEAAPEEIPFYDFTVYFRAFDNPWVGKSRDELVRGLGAPDAIYEARHQFADYDAGIPAATYIYVNGAASSGHCIDAYVVDEPTLTVIKYYCR